MLCHNHILKQKTQKVTKQIKVRDPEARMTQAYYIL
jgi:hypothetical protein